MAVDKQWSVYVDGTEVVDYLKTFDEAVRIGQEYQDDGYTDVVLYNYETKEEFVVA